MTLYEHFLRYSYCVDKTLSDLTAVVLAHTQPIAHCVLLANERKQYCSLYQFLHSKVLTLI